MKGPKITKNKEITNTKFYELWCNTSKKIVKITKKICKTEFDNPFKKMRKLHKFTWFIVNPKYALTCNCLNEKFYEKYILQ